MPEDYQVKGKPSVTPLGKGTPGALRSETQKTLQGQLASQLNRLMQPLQGKQMQGPAHGPQGGISITKVTRHVAHKREVSEQLQSSTASQSLYMKNTVSKEMKLRQEPTHTKRSNRSTKTPLTCGTAGASPSTSQARDGRRSNARPSDGDPKQIAAYHTRAWSII